MNLTLPEYAQLDEVRLLDWELSGDTLSATVSGIWWRPCWNPEDELPMEVRGSITLDIDSDVPPRTSQEVQNLVVDAEFRLSWR